MTPISVLPYHCRIAPHRSPSRASMTGEAPSPPTRRRSIGLRAPGKVSPNSSDRYHA